MSAYLVSEENIAYLVEACVKHQVEGAHVKNLQELSALGQKLWDENQKSVSYRYVQDKAKAPKYKHLFIFSGFSDFEPVQVLKSINHIDYQSGEHPTWEGSEAKRILEELKSAVIHSLPGYDDAIWGSPEPVAKRIVHEVRI